MQTLLRDRRGELDEAALVLPVLLLISLALINMALLGFAAVNAGNAANYGAHMGSVAVRTPFANNPASVAAASANQMLSAAPVGTYAVAVTGSGLPGDRMIVRVSYSVPNYFGGLAGLFGVSLPAEFSNTAIAYFRQEGW